MNALRQLQQTFQDYVRHGESTIKGDVVGTASANAEVRLNIYAHGYRARLLEALTTEYPGLSALAGEQDFDTLGHAYIDAHPSSFFNLRWFGDQLPAFLRASYPAEPAWSEMAAFEWAMGLAFDSPDIEALAFETVAAAPGEAWPGLKFRMHPGVQRIDLEWNVAEFWKAVDSQQTPDPIAQKSAQKSSAQAWVVWRKKLRTYFRSLDADEAWAMDALISGQNFAEICAGLCQWVAEDQVALHAASFLRNWIIDDMVVDMIVDTTVIDATVITEN